MVQIMLLPSLQNLLVNSTFLTLFLTTFYYWGLLSFFPKSSSGSSQNLPSLSFVGNLGFLMANIQLLGFLVLRWIDSHHFPLSNLYESLIFLSWSLTFSWFFLKQKTTSEGLIGAIIAPTALFIHAFASLILPDALKEATPLVPALQSNWLMMHVTLMIVSYSLLILGSLFSIALIMFTVVSSQLTPIMNPNSGIEKRESQNSLKSAELVRFLDNLSYRTLGFGFPLLTIGILSGAVWANQAWGSYWSWDPKETWAFITWLIFAIYFHFRLNKKWSGEKPAFIATIGFLFLWICYLGVNLLGKGLHSYGWF
jgi:cytochrome c-type biogenesis protein CcsB